jgi:hypothetical protein
LADQWSASAFRRARLRGFLDILKKHKQPVGLMASLKDSGQQELAP